MGDDKKHIVDENVDIVSENGECISSEQAMQHFKRFIV